MPASMLTNTATSRAMRTVPRLITGLKLRDDELLDVLLDINAAPPGAAPLAPLADVGAPGNADVVEAELELAEVAADIPAVIP